MSTNKQKKKITDINLPNIAKKDYAIKEVGGKVYETWKEEGSNKILSKILPYKIVKIEEEKQKEKEKIKIEPIENDEDFTPENIIAGIEPDSPFSPYIRSALEMMKSKPKPIEWVIPGLPARCVGVLSSAGGMGKSRLALQIAASIAVGGRSDKIDYKKQNKINWHPFNKGGIYTWWKDKDKKEYIQIKRNTVIFIAAEDTEDILQDNMNILYKNYIAKEEEKYLNKLIVMPVASKRFRIAVKTKKGFITGDQKIVSDDENQSKLIFSDEFKSLIKRTRAKLIVIDTLSKVLAGSGVDSNSNDEMAAVMEILIEFADEMNISILIITHSNKNSLNGEDETSSSVRGASTITDNARLSLALTNFSRNELTSMEDAAVIDEQYQRLPLNIYHNKRYYCNIVCTKSNNAMPPPKTIIKRGPGGFFILSDIDESTITKTTTKKKTANKTNKENNTSKDKSKYENNSENHDNIVNTDEDLSNNDNGNINDEFKDIASIFLA